MDHQGKNCKRRCSSGRLDELVDTKNQISDHGASSESKKRKMDIGVHRKDMETHAGAFDPMGMHFTVHEIEDGMEDGGDVEGVDAEGGNDDEEEDEEGVDWEDIELGGPVVGEGGSHSQESDEDWDEGEGEEEDEEEVVDWNAVADEWGGIMPMETGEHSDDGPIRLILAPARIELDPSQMSYLVPPAGNTSPFESLCYDINHYILCNIHHQDPLSSIISSRILLKTFRCQPRAALIPITTSTFHPFFAPISISTQQKVGIKICWKYFAAYLQASASTVARIFPRAPAYGSWYATQLCTHSAVTYIGSYLAVVHWQLLRAPSISILKPRASIYDSFRPTEYTAINGTLMSLTERAARTFSGLFEEYTVQTKQSRLAVWEFVGGIYLLINNVLAQIRSLVGLPQGLMMIRDSESFKDRVGFLDMGVVLQLDTSKRLLIDQILTSIGEAKRMDPPSAVLPTLKRAGIWERSQFSMIELLSDVTEVKKEELVRLAADQPWRQVIRIEFIKEEPEDFVELKPSESVVV